MTCRTARDVNGRTMKKGSQPVLHRRAFLASAAKAGKTLTAANFLRGCAGILTAALWPDRAYGQASELLVQPEEIQSRNGVLDAALTAAPGMVRLGGFTFPGTLYNSCL